MTPSLKVTAMLFPPISCPSGECRPGALAYMEVPKLFVG